MMTKYLPYFPEQQSLLPAALQDWLPDGHLAYFISDTVDRLDLSAFHQRYMDGGSGNQPFHLAMMVKVLIYSYATGIFSSRKIAKKLYEDIGFRVLAADNFPAHRTIRDFRAAHLGALAELFTQVVRLARELGLVKLGTIAVDGTKIKANASRHKAMSYARMQAEEEKLKQQIDDLLAKAQSVDTAEQDELELDIPAELARRQSRLEKIDSAKKRLEERQAQMDAQSGRSLQNAQDQDPKPSGGKPKRALGVPPDKAQDSFTDPQSRIMKRSGGGFDFCYNAQTAVDEAAHIVVAAEVVNTGSDRKQLPMVLGALKAHAGENAVQVLADAGYRSEEVMNALANDFPATEVIIAIGREKHGQTKSIDPKKYPRTAAMQHKLQSEEGKQSYRKRKWIAEPPNGWIKSILGFRQFSMRGLNKADGEFKLVCLALNLRRMGSMQANWG